MESKGVIMLTNEEFRSKLDHKNYMAREKKLKAICELNYSKPRMEKQLLLDAIEKERLNVVVSVDTEEKFYRSNYNTICTSGGINIRCRRFKEYYCISDISIGLMSIFWTQKVKLFYAALLANNSH